MIIRIPTSTIKSFTVSCDLYPEQCGPIKKKQGYLFIRLRWLWVNTSYRLGPSVYALQCLTGNNNNKSTSFSRKLLLSQKYCPPIN